MNFEDMPIDPSPQVEPTPELREAARSVRGLYLSFREAGFTSTEAMTLVLDAMRRGQQS